MLTTLSCNGVFAGDHWCGHATYPLSGDESGCDSGHRGPNSGASIGAAGAAVQMIQAGKVRAIATTGPSRSPSLSEIPTFPESGFNLTTDNFNGVYLPARTPPDIVERVHSDVLGVLQGGEVRQRLSAMGLETVGNSQAEFTKTVIGEIAQWRKVVKEAVSNFNKLS